MQLLSLGVRVKLPSYNSPMRGQIQRLSAPLCVLNMSRAVWFDFGISGCSQGLLQLMPAMAQAGSAAQFGPFGDTQPLPPRSLSLRTRAGMVQHPHPHPHHELSWMDPGQPEGKVMGARG